MNWNTLSIIDIISATVIIQVGFYHLFVTFKKINIRINASFASASISMGLYSILNSFVYGASTPETGVLFFCLQLLVVNSIFTSMLWFSYYYSGYKNNKIVISFTALFGVLLILQIIFINTPLTSLFNDAARIKMKIGTIIDTTVYQGKPGILFQIQFIAILSALIFCIYMLLKRKKLTGNKTNNALMLSLILFFGAVFNDISVTEGLYNFIFTAELSYLIIILTMTYTLFNNFVDLHKEVDELNKNLELKVKSRTGELQTANLQLIDINNQLKKVRDHLWGEMQLAKKIQSVLIPSDVMISKYDISTHIEPADEIGGDYYDIIHAYERAWIVIGDVSGHGVPAGLIMMMVQTAIHVTLDHSPHLTPSELLVRINSTISKNIKKLGEEKYMTITVLANYENGKFIFSGLHQDIMIYRAETNNVDVIETDGIWIGLQEDISTFVDDSSFTVNTGDAVLVYTDGITEAWKKGSIMHKRDPETDMFGVKRLKNLLLNLGNNETEEIKKGILKSLQEYDCRDDATMVIMKRLG